MPKKPTTVVGEQEPVSEEQAREDVHFEISEQAITLRQGSNVIEMSPQDALKLTQTMAGYLPLGLKARLAAFLTATVAKTIG